MGGPACWVFFDRDKILESFDVIIIGAGMAGLSAAYALAPSARVLVVDREETPGYHATGRSAAVYGASYGSEKPIVNALTKASEDFFLNPPDGFSEYPLYRDRGVLFVAHESQAQDLEAFYQQMKINNAHLQRLDREEVATRVPALKPEYCATGILDANVYELDVHALQEGYIRGLRRCDGKLVTGFDVDKLECRDGQWTVTSGDQNYCAPIVVNAAGAWVDKVAVLAGVNPVGIAPLKRTVILVDPPLNTVPDDWPMVVEFQEQFYFKPDAGKILVSSANEDLTEPCDAQAEELEIAYAAHYAEAATDLSIQRVVKSWAGLRSFVADRSPVIGFDEDKPGFFWLAGQGGYGIQTAPAAARLVASLILENSVSQELEPYNLSAEQFSRARLGLGAFSV